MTGLRQDLITDIAIDVLEVKNLEAQGNDSLDFHDIAIWTIEELLTRAFEAGQVYQAKQ